jgi:hypothetical protein
LSDPNAGLVVILRRSLPWIHLVSIFGFLIAGLIAVLGAASLAGMGGALQLHENPLGLMLHAVLLFTWLVPSFYLNKYARRIKVFLAQGHTVQLEAALEAERRFWMFAGGAGLILAFCTIAAVVVASF